MSNLTQRVLTAIVAVPILIALIVTGGVAFDVLIGGAVIIGLREFFAMMEARGFKPSKKTGYALGALFVAVASLSNEYYLTILVTFSALAIMVIQLYKQDVKASISGMAVTVFGLLYVAWLLSHAVLLRNVGFELIDKYAHLERFTQFAASPQDAERFAKAMGLFFVFLTLACTFLNDTGAYFAGRFFGRHKLAPIVSPKKTWEGAIGGVLTAMFAGAAVKYVFDRWVPDGNLVRFPYLGCVLVGFLLGISGILGDLTESLIKRDADIKDSGSILPGHGGMLDRIDALLFTLPVTYYVVKVHYYLRFS